MVIYILTFSKVFIKISVQIIDTIKKIINILLYPFKVIFNIVKNLIFKPSIFIFLKLKKLITSIIKNIKSKLSKINLNNKKTHKNNKKVQIKEGF